MNTRVLIDLIVRQTTVLIAQLSTSAGIRAPLADIADQVFVQLSQALEAQGVPRKVVADMFGLALRGYQRKVQRLAESVTERSKTLWQAVLDYLEQEGTSTRHALFHRFQNDDPAAIGAVLSDLVNSGLVFKTGTGDSALYGLTREQDLATFVRERELESSAALVWLTVYRSTSITRDGIIEALKLDPELLDRTLSTLTVQGRIQEQGGKYRAANLLIPVGAEQGWESAVFDHFQAMVTAIGMKLAMGRTRSDLGDTVGGSTLSFDVHPDHPYRERVLGLLASVRAQVNGLWNEVVAYEQEHPVPDNEKQRVSFYFGQFVQQTEEP